MALMSILLSLFLRLPKPGGPDSWIYFPQEQGSPVIPPGIEFSLSPSSSSSYIATNGQLSPWPDFNFLCLTITFFLLHVGRPLWWEDSCVICSAITHWLESRRTRNRILLPHLRLPQPGGPGPCIYLPKEQGGPVIHPALNSLSVTSYDLQGYGGGILTRLHTGILSPQSESQSFITTDGQSASLPWCQLPIWDPQPIFLRTSWMIFSQLRVCWCGASSLMRGLVCSF
jgi:hypothetical protein